MLIPVLVCVFSLIKTFTQADVDGLPVAVLSGKLLQTHFASTDVVKYLPSMVRSFVCVELCKMCRMPLLIRQVTYGYLCFYTHGCPERLRVRN